MASAHHTPAPVGGDVLVTFVAPVVDTNPRATYPFSFTVGAAGDMAVLAVMSENGQAGIESAVTGTTVDGVTAPPAVIGHHTSGNAAIYVVPGLTPGAHTLSITYSTGQGRAGMAHWKVTGASPTPADTDTAGALSGTTAQVTVDVPRGGAILAGYTTGNGVTHDWTGATEDWDAQPAGNTGMSAAHSGPAAAAGPVLVKVDHANTAQPLALAVLVLQAA